MPVYNRLLYAVAVALAAVVALRVAARPVAALRATSGAMTAEGPLVIYDNALRNGFVDRSSGLTAIDLCAPGRYASPPCGILASFTAAGGTLAFERAEGFSTAGHAALEFNYGAEPGYLANFEVRLIGPAGEVIGRSRLGRANITTNPAPGFSHVVVPVSALTPTDLTARAVQLVNTGGALIGIGFDDLQFAAAQSAAGCPPGQFEARYFATPDLSGPVAITRCEPAIDHDWGFGAPGDGVGPDGFSARWTGRVVFAAGSFTFSATADDGIRVALDGATIIDGWKDQARTTYTATRTLAAGEHEIVVEYYEKSGMAIARLSWEASAPPGSTATPSPIAAPTATPAGGYTIRQSLPPCPSGKWQTTLDTTAPLFTVTCQP